MRSDVLWEVIVSCGSKPNVLSSVVLAWTSGSSASDLFAAATRPLQTIDWNLAVVTLDVEASSDTASVEVQRSYSLSNDGITWDAPVALADAGWVSALGPSYGATYTLVPLSKAYIRFGVTTNQKAGTDLEQVRLVYTLTLAPR
jgi:hypothetical protein